jgi:hypothetical protein
MSSPWKIAEFCFISGLGTERRMMLDLQKVPCHGVELLEWQIVMVSSCQSSELSWCQVVRVSSCHGVKLSDW